MKTNTCTQSLFWWTWHRYYLILEFLWCLSCDRTVVLFTDGSVVCRDSNLGSNAHPHHVQHYWPKLTFSSHKLDFKFVRLLMTPQICIDVKNQVNATRSQWSRLPEKKMSGAIPATDSSFHYRHIPFDACQNRNAPPPEPYISFEASCTFYLHDQLQDPDIPTQTPLPRTGSMKTHRRSQFIFIGK